MSRKKFIIFDTIGYKTIAYEVKKNSLRYYSIGSNSINFSWNENFVQYIVWIEGYVQFTYENSWKSYTLNTQYVQQ